MLHIETVHPMDEYLNLLRSSAQIYIDNNRLNFAINDARWTAEKYRELTLMWLRIESAGKFTTVSRDTILDYLYASGVDMDHFSNRRTKGASLDMKRVVQPMIDAGIEVDLLSHYKTYSSYSSYVSFMETLGKTRKVHHTTLDGRMILQYDTNVVERDNLRAYYKDIAVVSIPKLYSNIITGKSDEYYIAWCDYPQADWRFAYNLFIKDAENQKVMEGTEDAYEGLAKLVERDAFSAEEFVDNRKQYKVNCLSVFYNSSNKSTICDGMRTFFFRCPRYRDYYNQLYLLQKFRLPIKCTSYFGFDQFLPENQIPARFVSKGLNTPIQTFTSEIVIETVFGVLNRFWSLGYTPEDINVYFVRHDEPLFMFRKTILRDAWIFGDCSTIHINGFTPIRLEFSYGKYYKEEDAQLKAEIEKVCEQNRDKYHTYEQGVMKPYHPIPSVRQVAVRTLVRDSALKFEVYDYATQSSYIAPALPTVPQDFEEVKGALVDVLETQFAEKLGKPQYLLVKFNGMDYMTNLWESTLLKVIPVYDTDVFCEEVATHGN